MDAVEEGGGLVVTAPVRGEGAGPLDARPVRCGLCVGYVPDAMHTGLLPAALRTLRLERPGIHVALYGQQSAEQFEGLRQRSLDIALVQEPPAENDPDLRSALLLEDPLLLVLPAGHPLAEKADLVPEDLDGQPWIAVESSRDPGWRDAFVAACVAAGFTPGITLDAAEPPTALGLVASGIGVALVQRSMVRGTAPGVAVRELPWHGGSARLWAAWHRVDLRPVVGPFRATVLDAAPA